MDHPTDSSRSGLRECQTADTPFISNHYIQERRTYTPSADTPFISNHYIQERSTYAPSADTPFISNHYIVEPRMDVPHDNPSSPDSYTKIFNKVREERLKKQREEMQGGSAKRPVMLTDSSDSDDHELDSYTKIFNKVREERLKKQRGEMQGGSTKIPVMLTDSSYSDDDELDSSGNSTMCFCFSWGKK